MKKPKESKLNIHDTPDRFGKLERAAALNNFIAKEFDTPQWIVPEDYDKNNPEFFGLDPLAHSLEDTSFLEGFMSALAFCSGSISGGKCREFMKGSYDKIDRMTLTNFATACMNMQTLWEKN